MYVYSFLAKDTDYEHPMKAQIKDIWKIGLMWQAKYASAVPKKFAIGIEFSAVQWRQFPLWTSVVRG